MRIEQEHPRDHQRPGLRRPRLRPGHYEVVVRDAVWIDVEQPLALAVPLHIHRLFSQRTACKPAVEALPIRRFCQLHLKDFLRNPLPDMTSDGWTVDQSQNAFRRWRYASPRVRPMASDCSWELLSQHWFFAKRLSKHRRTGAGLHIHPLNFRLGRAVFQSEGRRNAQAVGLYVLVWLYLHDQYYMYVITVSPTILGRNDNCFSDSLARKVITVSPMENS